MMALLIFLGAVFADEYKDFVYLEMSLKMPQWMWGLEVLIPSTDSMNR